MGLRAVCEEDSPHGAGWEKARVALAGPKPGALSHGSRGEGRPASPGKPAVALVPSLEAEGVVGGILRALPGHLSEIGRDRGVYPGMQELGHPRN